MGGQESVLPDCNSVAVACYRDISPNTEEEEARRQVRLATEACCAVHKPSRVWDLTAHGLQGTTPSPSWCPLRGEHVEPPAAEGLWRVESSDTLPDTEDGADRELEETEAKHNLKTELHDWMAQVWSTQEPDGAPPGCAEPCAADPVSEPCPHPLGFCERPVRIFPELLTDSGEQLQPDMAVW
eukprot:CAMPEP_0204391380 /NCGR_PEP_ID=MMETSP0469-20131031/61219_1 /ASSEMBLY_ACC=CAM_ASM_000384 /TAXON_ID=2969 /ORGANISM="Oxyrrhis marina" /LENGTH=182 /DNA_ID=CAMNT_0051385335 /DNA_START=26 /DNA_END=571 /DNA_ORIENTATION=+